ncbi:phytoene/squalene synthase family protein [Acidobacteriota bacterium]
MVDQDLKSIFKQGSRTYFTSSHFFPRPVREDVIILYGFVRTADNFVDILPQREEDFYKFWDELRRSRAGETGKNPVVKSFTELERKKGFPHEWVDAFLRSMEMDLHKKEYKTIEEILAYIHGSAEVIGLFMASIMGLHRESFPFARRLGRAMQYINFIRDIAEDNELGRTYFPQNEMREFGLQSLNENDVASERAGFQSFIHAQIRRYRDWQIEAEQGFRYIPRRYLIPIKTASDMYKWTALRIEKNPFIVYKMKVKPSKMRIFKTALSNVIARKA